MNSLLTFFDTETAVQSRRNALGTVGKLGLGAALASVPFLKPGVARAQSGSGDVAILNYALTLEYLERSFYRQALDSGTIPGDVRPLFQTIYDDEAAHVDFLRGALEGAGANPVDYTDSDFAFGDFVTSFAGIAALAQGLEDTGVRAYKGQAAAISTPAYLQAALQIHSVEARHAAAIRRLSQSPAAQGWIPNSQPDAPAPIAPVYGAGSPASQFPAEGNTTQGGVQLTTALSGYSATEISAAFDEPLDMDTVLGIAGQFITGSEGDGND
ncbi:ferritin-like domain-containing protein [Rubrivirga marina]|uniref:Ferritin-like domain-containing protein n=1 Tax=Rubrivirga marina TaxID=1196024 RepID=A0A271IXP2_9BACT|nr:ferritin-like domain-containing protein [Rubrivirga marina]PAP75574.1 hypothetical protein BSZ37_03535 [Rubrivirga marina]